MTTTHKYHPPDLTLGYAPPKWLYIVLGPKIRATSLTRTLLDLIPYAHLNIGIHLVVGRFVDDDSAVDQGDHAHYTEQNAKDRRWVLF